MKIWQSMLLGLVQGLTEFIPVSSSGHIVLTRHFIHAVPDSPLLLEISVHMGTLFALFIVYRRKLLDLAGFALHDAFQKCGEKGWLSRFREDERGKTILFILVACIPTAIIGLIFKDTFEGLFGNPPFASAALIVTGIALFSTRWIPATLRDKGKLGLFQALGIGLIQGLAIIPGISRSGSTISAGMWLGIKGNEAADFSFILSIPAIIGAFFLVIKDISTFYLEELPPLAAGFIVAAVSGYLSLEFLLRHIRKGGLSNFAWYCWILALASLAAYYL
ncbi:undecaprenyl-diphosphate phosphatase [Candidatus Sumerlaeota bacterium]|nr:undecaprenyl-diphosphate phosphatase [Candidatus Sumerlaeota bacterium]